MEKHKLAAMIGAVSALAATPAAAMSSNLATVMHVESYADLLKPVPDAAAVLAAYDAAMPMERAALPGDAVRTVQYHDHHHHHHRRPPPRRYHHHHHHHHHNSAAQIVGRAVEGLVR